MISSPFLSIRSGVKISQEYCGNLEIEGDADGVDDGGNEGPGGQGRIESHPPK